MDRLTKFLLCLIFLVAGNSPVWAQSGQITRADHLPEKVTFLELRNETIFDGIAKLSQTVEVGFSVERELTSKKAPQLAPKIRLNSRIQDASVRDIMNWLCDLDPRYGWTSDGQTVNVFPVKIKEETDYPLNRRIEHFEMKDVTTADAAVLAVARHATPSQQVAVMHIGNSNFGKPQTFVFSGMTLRDALNAIARQLGPTSGWQFSGTDNFHYVVFHDHLLPEVAQQSNSNGQQPLQRPLNSASFEGSSPSAAAHYLANAETPGGIISVRSGCSEARRLYQPVAASLGKALASVQQTDASLTWQVGNGIIVVHSGSQSTNTILKVRVGQLHLATVPLERATEDLLRAPEVRAQIYSLGLGQLPDTLGFSALKNGNSAHDMQAVPELEVNTDTVEGVLNRLALKHGKAVWLYEQIQCEGKSSFRITWVVQ